jgi:dolichol kinase
MNDIDYSWDGTHQDGEDIMDQQIEIGTSEENTDNFETDAKSNGLKTRHDLQMARRLFHMANGSFIATLYWISFDHSQMVHFLGTIACLLYVVEQVRIKYPEKAAKLLPFTKFIIRAEEQLKESAMVPYAMAVLLTIITFPKEIALVGIYALAFADPLSALIGIKYGKHKISPTRSYEGSLAFFGATFISSFVVLTSFYPDKTITTFFLSFALGICGAFFDLIPLKIDDNLTIPLFVSAALWTLVTITGVL